MASTEKHEFFVVDDYGMGGIWAIIWAPAEEDIAARYPELKVQRERPKWMTDELYLRLTNVAQYDIDDEPEGCLKDVVDRRKNSHERGS